MEWPGINYTTMTFYVYLIWQLLVTSYQMSYVTALFVNMVFGDEDKILTKIYHLKDTMRDS